MVCALVKPDFVDRDINSEYKVRDNVFEDRIVFDFGKKKGQDPTVITVNCIDNIGLASDLTRTILEFGLDVSRAGRSTIPTHFLFIDFHTRVFLNIL
jgi:UTP:GlnB (protein PII) uridylyltransferase